MNKVFDTNNSIKELIKERTSIRTYKSLELENKDSAKLISFINKLTGPFNSSVRFKILDNKGDINGAKLGTYGVIKGASNYIGVAVKKSNMDLEELGYEMEKVILYATSLGISTCWLGGTFKRSEFSKVMDLEADEIFPIITPIGYAANKKRIIDSAFRFVAKSKTRKEWGELFFLLDFSTPMTEFNNVGNYKEVLEAVRLAPSASNKQPWRIVKIDGEYHFYIQRTKGYSDKLGFDIQRIDMGIAMCHFELTCTELGLKGKFKKVEPKIKSVPENTEYVISWVKE